MLILWYFEYTTVGKISENETALNCGFRFAIANPIKSRYLLIKVRVIM